jgi:ABC-2 type transport system permease protein
MLTGFRPSSFIGIILSIVLMFLISLLFTALGTAIASRLEDMHAFQMIMNFIIMPLFFLSGALFPLANLPPALAFVTHVNPLSYGVDGLRAVLTNTTHFGLATDVSVLVVSALALLGIGSWLFSKIEI